MHETFSLIFMWVSIVLYLNFLLYSDITAIFPLLYLLTLKICDITVILTQCGPI